MSSIQTQLAAQGLGFFDSNGNFVVIQRVVQAIDIAPFTAAAGQIYLFGSQVQGSGVLDAPTEVAVTITNDTFASLQIEGITVPQNLGGIYVNGALLTGSSLGADVTTINTLNASGSGAAFSAITIALPPAPPSANQLPSAVINIANVDQYISPTDAANGVVQPSIIINGPIEAVFAALNITSFNDIDVTGTGGYHVYAANFQSKNNITIDEVQFYASGDPSAQLLGSPAVGETILDGSLAAATQAITNYENTPRTTQFNSQTVTIQSEYIDLNGEITAGEAEQDLTINPSDVATQIQTILDEKAGSPQLLSLPAADNPDDDFSVFFDPSTDSIVVEPVTLAGGLITIKGHVASTSTATLTAFGYYGDVNITNNTSYNLAVDGIDASQHGAGIVDITDLNQVQSGTSNVLEAKYVSTQGGGMSVSKNYVDPVTGAPAGAGSVTSSSSNATQFDPLAGLRYNFSVAFGTQTVTTSTYYESNWIGVFNLGSGTLTAPPVTTVIEQPTVLASSLYFYVDTASESTPYIFTSTTHTLANSGMVAGANWSTSTWYGKKTYYQSYSDTVKSETIADTSIKADLPINIVFSGQTTAGITINSPNSSVIVYGDLANITGVTSITAGGSITTPVPSTTIEGVQVDLSAGGSIRRQRTAGQRGACRNVRSKSYGGDDRRRDLSRDAPRVDADQFDQRGGRSGRRPESVWRYSCRGGRRRNS